MPDRTDLLDLTNNLLAQLRLIEMASASVEDVADRDALQIGAAAALDMLNTMKTMLSDVRSETLG